MQLGLAHRALEAEQKAIVELGRIVDAVFIEDEGCGQGAQLDEAMPIGRVAGEPRDFQAHDDAGLAERHLADEFLEAVARRRARSGLAEIAIDDMNVLDRPACGDRAITQRILALRTLAVFGDLTQRRLADIEIGIALEMVGGDLEFRHGHGLHCEGDDDAGEEPRESLAARRRDRAWRRRGLMIARAAST